MLGAASGQESGRGEGEGPGRGKARADRGGRSRPGKAKWPQPGPGPAAKPGRDQVARSALKRRHSRKGQLAASDRSAANGEAKEAANLPWPGLYTGAAPTEAGAGPRRRRSKPALAGRASRAAFSEASERTPGPRKARRRSKDYPTRKRRARPGGTQRGTRSSAAPARFDRSRSENLTNCPRPGSPWVAIGCPGGVGKRGGPSPQRGPRRTPGIAPVVPGGRSRPGRADG
jgi:hypothetical protein